MNGAVGVRGVARPTSYVHERVRRWRTGSTESQTYVLAVLLACVTACFLVSWWAYDYMPLTSYFVWLLIGMLLLRPAPLALLSSIVLVAAVAAMVHSGPIEGPRLMAISALVLSVGLILYSSSRQRSGLPVTLSEAMLSELRDRLQRQAVMPPLPAGWEAQSAVRSSQGLGYAGDFFVADLVEPHRLEMVLVDVCGKGVAVGPQALQLAGALGGLLGALPPRDLLQAANRFLLRQQTEDSFSTAVHVIVDLDTGDYTVTSAGHPPALRWESAGHTWVPDNSRGTALGVVAEPELISSSGRLEAGDGLLFYTDGVVETRSADLEEGIDWLRATAREAVRTGFDGAAKRIIRKVPRGDDDRAVLILSRSLA